MSSKDYTVKFEHESHGTVFKFQYAGIGSLVFDKKCQIETIYTMWTKGFVALRELLVYLEIYFDGDIIEARNLENYFDALDIACSTIESFNSDALDNRVFALAWTFSTSPKYTIGTSSPPPPTPHGLSYRPCDFLTPILVDDICFHFYDETATAPGYGLYSHIVKKIAENSPNTEVRAYAINELDRMRQEGYIGSEEGGMEL